MSVNRAPLYIIPDLENLPSGFKTVPFASSVGEFRSGPGIVTLKCLSMRQYLNVQRMMELYLNGVSPLLCGHGITSEDILFQTGAGHELRHFHDSLLSFSFLEATRRKLILGVNMRSIFRAYHGSNDDGLFPIPLMEWVMADDEARERAVQSLKEFFGDDEISVCDLPQFSTRRLEDITADPDPFRDAVLVCTRSAFSIDLLVNREVFEDFPTPTDVFELSAIAAQFLTISDRFGFRAAKEIFENHLTDTYYDRALDLMANILQGDSTERIFGPNALILTSAMALSAICSAPPPFPTHPAACPSVRLAKLYSLVLEQRSEVKKRLFDVEELLSFFDSLMEEPSLKLRVEETTRYFEKVTSDMRELSKDPALDPMFAAVLRYWEELLLMRKQLQEAVTDNIYLHLRGYYESHLAHELTTPPIIVDCTDLEPASYADDPRGAGFAENIQGKEKMFRISDRMNALKQEIEFIEEADLVVMKLFFGVDGTKSEERRRGLDDTMRHCLGRDLILFQELKGEQMRRCPSGTTRAQPV